MKSKRTIWEAYQWASSFLQACGFEDYSFEAELLLRRLLQVDRAHFFTYREEKFPEELKQRFEEWLLRRAGGEPLQYIFGDQEFYGRLFQVNSSVLIPRPETELLVELVLQTANQIWGDKPLQVIDVGTGSGAIAVTLAAERPHWQVTAIDISAEALAVARKNAKTYGVEQRIQWVLGEYLTPLLERQAHIDILVSNPPYIPSAVIPTLEKQVRQFEPILALDGGADGLKPYRVLTRQLTEWNSGCRLIAFEIGADQGDAVSAMVQQISKDMEVMVYRDLAGLNRMVIGRMKNR